MHAHDIRHLDVEASLPTDVTLAAHRAARGRREHDPLTKAFGRVLLMLAATDRYLQTGDTPKEDKKA
jgi:hypothetical protein